MSFIRQTLDNAKYVFSGGILGLALFVPSYVWTQGAQPSNGLQVLAATTGMILTALLIWRVPK